MVGYRVRLVKSNPNLGALSMATQIKNFLFNRSIYEAELRRYYVPDGELDEKLDLLHTLREADKNGNLNVLTETKVEQSFNEQLFCRIFNYKSLFMKNGEEFNIQPKSYSGSGSYNDFSLGYFGVNEGACHYASCELKNPGYDLFKSQPGKYEGKSAVEQAFESATKFETVEWVLVCNFTNLLLFPIDDPDDCLFFDLLEIVKRSEMHRLLFALSSGGLFFKGKYARLQIVRHLSRS